MVIIMFGAFSVSGQSLRGGMGGWLMFFNTIRFHEKWSTQAEVQYRSYELVPNTEQLLLRAGLNYHITPASFASIGYAYAGSFAFDKELNEGIQVNEHRLWQQFYMKQTVKRAVFEHRYRLEERWQQLDTTTRYLTRARYFLRATVPLNHKELVKNTVFLSFYDEVFINFLPSPFDRNRAYAAVGYQFIPEVNLQLGYLAQTVGSTRTKHYLQVALFYNADLRKKKTVSQPIKN